jgi:hypothetical protein
MSARLRRLGLLALCLLFGLLCLAPTPGDIGGCGAPADLLGARPFFEKKRDIDCGACSQCGIHNRTCDALCSEPIPNAFPRGCFPLVHDGEVCLRALSYSSCEQYRTYLDDRAPRTPSECDFCPVLSDGGARRDE